MNTEHSTNWAVKAFKDWMEQHRVTCPDDVCPEYFLDMKHSKDP